MTDEKKLEELKKEIQQEELTPFNWEVIKGDKLLKADIPKSEFLVDKLIPKSAITILAGNPSSGKSWLLLEIAKTVASNRSLFDKFETQEARTLYIDMESPKAELKRRWEMLDPAILTLVDFMPLPDLNIENEDYRQGLLDLCKWRGYKLIIFDSLRDLFLGNENNSQEVQKLIEFFREFVRKDITVLVCHHLRKEFFTSSNLPSQSLRGSGVLLSGIDSFLSVEATKKTESLIEMLISQPKLRQGKPNSPFKVQLIEMEGKMSFEWKTEVEDDDTKLERAKEAILNLLSDGEKYQKQIVEMLIPLYYRERTIHRAIKELKDEHKVKPVKREKKIFLSLDK